MDELLNVFISHAHEDTIIAKAIKDQPHSSRKAARADPH
jgi:hypothetical protein